MPILHSAFGYLVLLVIAWLSGRRSRTIPWKTLGVATLLQLALTSLLLQPVLRNPIFALIGHFTALLKKTALKANQSLLFSGLSSHSFTGEHGHVFALEITATLIFVASLSRILYHYGILPWLIARLSRIMQKLMGISSAESVGMAANIFLGMTEAPLLIRPYVARLTESELLLPGDRRHGHYRRHRDGHIRHHPRRRTPRYSRTFVRRITDQRPGGHRRRQTDDP